MAMQTIPPTQTDAVINSTATNGALVANIWLLLRYPLLFYEILE
jgi:hypothetical protein